ncbi:sucrose-6-phosphate hydrolase [Rathayibacter sp. VKM Ac-2760]|uniref:sucrose-6-phosphate hydrolase n=1 Tax=Rathayibacter sp. VKM Ac-2760 TaxID=2609253 RepID=UPI001318A6A3|nr:sucrose-6-phosphate hydrolase [Rathayibacter sp. VKM Ac-2760]QHC57208.1 sucrose-6-phosphate hydrolase [Rathayibacter sp. VKM Ac-2760]
MIAAFLDLDRTLIHSARSVGAHREGLAVVEHIDGSASAFAPAGLAADLTALATGSAVVPTTTRSVAQLRRVTLFDDVPHRFEIAANGGVILEHGAPDPEWSARVAEAVRDTGVSVPHVRDLAAGLVPGATARVVDDVFVYLVSPDAESAEEATVLLGPVAVGLGWRCSRQGRKVYLVPEVVEKAVAVAEVARRLGARIVLAAGDAELDRRMLREADHAVVPAHAEVLRPPGVHTTAAAGPLASTEIVRWLRDVVEQCHQRSAPAGPEPKETPWTSVAG